MMITKGKVSNGLDGSVEQANPIQISKESTKRKATDIKERKNVEEGQVEITSNGLSSTAPLAVKRRG